MKLYLYNFLKASKNYKKNTLTMDMNYVYSNRLVDKSENDLLALEKLLNMSMNLYEQLSCSNCNK